MRFLYLLLLGSFTQSFQRNPSNQCDFLLSLKELESSLTFKTRKMKRSPGTDHPKVGKRR